LVPQANQTVETGMRNKKKARKESREERSARNDEAHAAITRVASKDRGHYKEEIKKLSPKAQRKFRDAEAHAKAKKAGDQAEALSAKAKSAFYALPRKVRDSLRERYKNDGWSYASWLLNGSDKYAKRARRARNAAKQTEQWKDFGAFLKASGQKRIKVKDVDPAKDKRIAKEIRAAMKMPAPPKNPFAALLIPMVIVPDNPEHKVVVADAGSIVRLADQSTLYRDRVSPITRRADEILVHFGKADKPSLGWLTNRFVLPAKKVMKPSKGPTFLVKTRSEDALMAWEQLRLKIARTRMKDPTNWVAPWLATHGSKYPRELREVTRLFGGKPIKNESFEDRCMRLFTLILNTELDMASAKKSKSKKKGKKNKKATEEKSTKKSKKSKSGKKAKSSRVGSDRITKKHDNYVIKRLVKENPRRAGSDKAKIWNKLKKGMTVGEFAEKGGSRASVGRYIKNGWVKLLRPKGGDDE
jgi:hypothetical protein